MPLTFISHSHIHLYFGVGIVVMNDEILELEAIDVSDSSPNLQSGKWSRCSLELKKVILLQSRQGDS